MLHREAADGSQVSVADTDTVTGTSLWSGAQSTDGAADKAVITGGVVSTTVTVVMQLLVLCELSLTLQVTEVEPSGNEEPEPWHVGVPRLGQLSVAVGVRLTIAPAADVH